MRHNTAVPLSTCVRARRQLIEMGLLNADPLDIATVHLRSAAMELLSPRRKCCRNRIHPHSPPRPITDGWVREWERDPVVYDGPIGGDHASDDDPLEDAIRAFPGAGDEDLAGRLGVPSSLVAVARAELERNGGVPYPTAGVVADLLRADPAATDRAVARKVGCPVPWVRSIRGELDRYPPLCLRVLARGLQADPRADDHTIARRFGVRRHVVKALRAGLTEAGEFSVRFGWR
jgi:hypothetical protein